MGARGGVFRVSVGVGHRWGCVGRSGGLLGAAGAVPPGGGCAPSGIGYRPASRSRLPDRCRWCHRAYGACSQVVCVWGIRSRMPVSVTPPVVCPLALMLGASPRGAPENRHTSCTITRRRENRAWPAETLDTWWGQELLRTFANLASSPLTTRRVNAAGSRFIRDLLPGVVGAGFVVMRVVLRRIGHARNVSMPPS